MSFLKQALLVSILLTSLPVAMAETAGSTADSALAQGTVTETIDVSKYTYIKTEESDLWVAAPNMTLLPGDRIEYSGGMEMGSFYSKALDRTFDNILFVDHVNVVSRNVENMHGAALAGHKTVAGDFSHPDSVSVEPPAAGEIPLLEGGVDIAAIYAGSVELNGQTVKLRARVMKVSENVMGRNWVTLQDGTGSTPDDKLLATSAEPVAPGDLVIASGVLGKDVDIGSGYKYKVLLEQATFLTSEK